jgi:hypothetical protein
MLITPRVRSGAALTALLAAAAAVLVPAAAVAQPDDSSWIEGDRYHEVLYDDDVPGFPHEKMYWTAKCPADFPYLDGSVPNERETGRGIIVTEPRNRVIVYELSDGGLRDRIRVGDGVWRAGGNTGHIANRGTEPVRLHLEMVCTADPAEGWSP